MLAIHISHSDWEPPRRSYADMVEGDVIGTWRFFELVPVIGKVSDLRFKCVLCGHYTRKSVYDKAKVLAMPCAGCWNRRVKAEIAEIEAEFERMGKRFCICCGKRLSVEASVGTKTCSKRCSLLRTSQVQAALYAAKVKRRGKRKKARR